MKSSLFCLLMLSFASIGAAQAQDMKNKICTKDRCVYFPSTLEDPTTSKKQISSNISSNNTINNKFVEKQLSKPTSTVYKYRDVSGRWVYADHLPEKKHLIYYIVDEQ